MSNVAVRELDALQAAHDWKKRAEIAEKKADEYVRRADEMAAESEALREEQEKLKNASSRDRMAGETPTWADIDAAREALGERISAGKEAHERRVLAIFGVEPAYILGGEPLGLVPPVETTTVLATAARKNQGRTAEHEHRKSKSCNKPLDKPVA